MPNCCLRPLLPDEQHVSVGRLFEAGLFDGVPPRQGVKNLEQGHGIGDLRYTLERRIDHVRVHDLIAENWHNQPSSTNEQRPRVQVNSCGYQPTR